VTTSSPFDWRLFRSKVLSIDKSQFEPTQESVQSVSIDLFYQICVKIFSLAVDKRTKNNLHMHWVSVFIITYSSIETFASIELTFSFDRINSRSKQPSIELVITWYRFGPHCHLCSNEINIAAVSGSTRSSLHKMQRGSHNVHGMAIRVYISML